MDFPMILRRLSTALLLLLLPLLALTVFAQEPSATTPVPIPKNKPRVIVVGVNGMELDILRPLLVKGALPNLASVIKRGSYGKLRTVSGPNCPRVYATMFTST